MIDHHDIIWFQIFDSSPAGMSLTMGAEHTLVRVNRKFHEIMGLHESVIGKLASEALPDIVEQGYLALLDCVYESGKSYTCFEARLVQLDVHGVAQERFFDLSFQPLRNSDSEVYGILMQVFDVTEKVRSRMALERSKKIIENERRNLRHLFQHTPELVCIMRGPEHLYEFVNDAHAQVLGFNACGMTVRQALPHLKLLHEVLDKIYSTGEVANFHEQAVMLNGRRHYFNLTYSAYRDESGSVDGILALGMDVSAQVLARQALEQSEARFKLLADSMPQIIYIARSDKTVTFLNARCLEYTGVYDPALWNQASLDMIHPDDQAEVCAAWQRAADTKTTLSAEVRLRDHHGAYRWFITRAVPHVVDNEIIEWFGTSTDIHDSRLAAEELARSRERYRIVFEDSPLPMWIYNPEGENFFDANNMAIKAYGYTREEFLSMTVSELCPPEDKEEFLHKVRNLPNARDHAVHCKGRHRKKDGRIMNIEATLRDIKLNDRWVRLVAVVDVTCRLAAEEQLRQLMQKLQSAKEEAETANHLKSAFLANMSHEIRTPLGAMLGFADLLRDPNISRDEHANYLDILVRNGEQLSIIINDILDLSKVEAGHLTLEFLEVNPDTIVRDVLTLLEIKAREKNIALVYEPDPNALQLLTTDPVRLRQVLINLLSNAIKFTAQGSVHIRSYGKLNAQSRRQLCFEIIDTGIGIAEDHHERIFEMFVQADDTTTRKFGGTGLGLALSRKLARALGGDVRVLRSQPAVGSTFLFTLTDLPELREQPSEERREEPPPAPIPAAEGVSLEGLRVLVVDDAPDIRSLIAFLLARAGAAVEFAENGMEGYRKALSQSYDMVLMDIQMPLMDGYTATMKLREQGYRKPIIALTAHAMTEAHRKCLSVGCTGYLPKPINPSHLLGVVAFHARHY